MVLKARGTHLQAHCNVVVSNYCCAHEYNLPHYLLKIDHRPVYVSRARTILCPTRSSVYVGNNNKILREKKTNEKKKGVYTVMSK